MDIAKYKKKELTLEKGDVLFLYTDGVTEAMNEKDEQYGEDRLKKLLDDNCDKSVEELSNVLKNDIAFHRGNAEQSDDITILALK